MQDKPVWRYSRPRRVNRRPKSAARVNLSAALVVPPFTGTLWTQVPSAPAAQTLATPTPVTLTVGDPPVIQLDIRAALAEAARFIAEHPLLCTAIATGVVYVIWASHQPPRSAREIWG